MNLNVRKDRHRALARLGRALKRRLRVEASRCQCAPQDEGGPP